MADNVRKMNRATRIRLREFASYAKGRKRILDVGLFYHNRALVEQKAPSQIIYGFDIRMRDLPEGYDYMVKGDVQKISRYFDGNFFDVIFLGEVIEHVTDPYRTIREISKILRENGVLVISTLNPHGFPLIFIEWLGIKKLFYTRYHAFLFPPRWMERILESNELRIVKKYGFDFFMNFRVPVQLSYVMLFVSKKHKGLPAPYRAAPVN
jgi:SAM-dependent methyltransferase